MIYWHVAFWTLLSSSLATSPCDRTAITGTDDLGFVSNSVAESLDATVYGMRFCDNLDNKFSISAIAGQPTVVEVAIDDAAASLELRDPSGLVVPTSILQVSGGFRVEFIPGSTGTFSLHSTATSPVPLHGSRYNVAVAVDQAAHRLPYPLLSMSELVPGEPALLGINNAEPGSVIYFAASQFEGSWCLPADPTVCMGLHNPVELARGIVAPDGTLVVSVDVPSQLPAGPMLFQAVTVWGEESAVTPVVAIIP